MYDENKNIVNPGAESDVKTVEIYEESAENSAEMAAAGGANGTDIVKNAETAGTYYPEQSQTQSQTQGQTQDRYQSQTQNQYQNHSRSPYSDQSRNQYQNQGQYRNAYQNPYRDQSRNQSQDQYRSQDYGQYQYQQNSYRYGGSSQGSNDQNGAPKKKGNFFLKAVGVVAGALVFGAVAGVTMFGVNRVANYMFPMENQIQMETQAALENTPIVSADEAAPATPTGVVIEDVSPIVEAAMPSVVAINNTTVVTSSTWFGQQQTYEVPSSGSGIIVGQNETELLVVTNNHVIEDSSTLSVTFIDECTIEAAIKGTDSESDLAVIAVPLEDIPAETRSQIKAATIGDSDTLKMGQGVIAIGNALGHGQSVTVGHISALDREITIDGIQKTVIQTDAAINPGNSGGALLNAKGELVGINEAKYADETVEGVGYAIPISYAMDIIEDLKLRPTKIELAESEQGYLGIQVQNVDAQTAQMLGMPQGVYVYKIMEDSAAANSDLREKDIITKFDGEKVQNNADLTGLLSYYKAGSTVTITVQSLENGTYVEREVEVTLKNRPEEPEEKTDKE